MAVRNSGSLWMSENDYYRLCTYIEECAALLNLNDWSISVSRNSMHEDSDNEAECEFRGDYKDARITFSARFSSFDPEHKRRLIAHELCHIHTSV